jgi:predicted DNA-binding transcriptional regulator AlpA
MGRSEHPRTLADFLRWLASAPQGTSLDAHAMREWLEPLAVTEPAPVSEEPAPPVLSWRERLWLVPAETRIGVTELCEALGRPRSWVYRHTSAKSGCPLLPHRKLDGELLFAAGEIRAWVREQEEIGHAGPSDSTAAERRGWRVIDGAA